MGNIEKKRIMNEIVAVPLRIFQWRHLYLLWWVRIMFLDEVCSLMPLKKRKS